ncbi:MAG: tripartite tricarboxylate transporter TctB family protein [Firmicutes bacterium]|mgnify:FL=1|jgi:putative tricarboxylic transport membrane protein|nr:tripartite tricarboxylate transporter TctB family protein [Bacillota bacterium]
MEYKKNLIPGIVLTIFSIIYLVLTSQIKKFSGLGSDPLGARAIPYLWGISLLVLSLILVVRGIKQRNLAIKNNTLVKSELNFTGMIKENREIVLTFVSLAVYIALLEPVGFLIMTAVYLFVQTLILTPKEKRNYIVTLITSIVIAVALDYVFVCLLNVLLPLGIFGF